MLLFWERVLRAAYRVAYALRGSGGVRLQAFPIRGFCFVSGLSDMLSLSLTCARRGSGHGHGRPGVPLESRVILECSVAH